jgi:hypothetical protein
MSPTFEFTPEQRHVLLSSSPPITVAVSEGERQYVIIEKDVYERLKGLLQVDEADPSFFDCEETDLPPAS